MPARLIINADDFGLTPGINRSIEQLHRAGALSSATLMASGPAFEDAITVARRNPSLGVGCHVVLTDGIPVSPPQSIPSLLGPDHVSLRPSLAAFAAAAVLGRLRPEDIRVETLAQIRKIQGAGVTVTHLDTHKHTHMFPAVHGPLLEAARLASVPAVRNPFEQRWSFALNRGQIFRRLQLRVLNTFKRSFIANVKLQDDAIRTTDGTLGISVTGRLDSLTLRQLLEPLPEGAWELVCHPGYNDPDLDRIATRLRSHRDIERTALLAIVPEVLSQPDAPSLIHYGDLRSRTASAHPIADPHERRS